jgi:tRNA/rRNA methyltransferase
VAAAFASCRRARYHIAGRRLAPIRPVSVYFVLSSPVILNRSPSHSPSAVVHTVASGPQRGFTSTSFVLVEPSHPGNVGAAARALKTMGFSRLVLVAPRVAQVQTDPEAIAMASGAEDVLASARIVPTIADALAGVTWSVALTARMREYGPPQLAPREAANEARTHVRAGDIAFVFGNERTGLSNEHVERCSALAHIPANPAYSSLNLAQAVQVLAYELRIAYLAGEDSAAGSTVYDETASGRAANDDIERMYVHLENALIALDFLDPANPKKLMSRLRRLFARAGLEREEVNIVRGIAKHILLKTPPRDRS